MLLRKRQKGHADFSEVFWFYSYTFGAILNDSITGDNRRHLVLTTWYLLMEGADNIIRNIMQRIASLITRLRGS